ncbi:protein zntD-like [Bolinopsis microptera]|uniref:protein zntD-like n=1 Tax=Bolinopsis microptera TaxID=2820187 RepID=UPI003079D40D
MTLPEWEEQGYHFAGMLITFSFAWLGICVAITVEKCSPKATSCLNLFAGGVLFAGGMIHLLSDSLIILRRHSEEHGQLLALILTSTTYIFLFILHVSVTGYFGEKLHRKQKKTDEIQLIPDNDSEDENTEPSQTNRHTDEGDIFIASLQKSGLRSSALLMGVLSIHSFLAGVAFGSQPDPAEEFKIMIPISAHKSLAAMALTLTFRGAKIKKFNMFILLLIFSCSTPTGTLLGMIVSSQVKSSLWSGICLSIAAGTFIFVTINDIIPDEIVRDTELMVPKCFSLVLGFILMTLLALWI